MNLDYFNCQLNGGTVMNTEIKGSSLAEIKESVESSKAFEVLSKFYDDGVFTQIDAYVTSQNTLAEVVTAYGAVNGCPVYAFAQNSTMAGGVMSKAQASKLVKLYDLALKTGTPVVGFYDSVGARLAEGVDMLAAYGDILNKTSNLSGVVPQISVILGICLGTGALNAASADFVIMSEKAQFSLATNGEGGSFEEAEKDGIVHITAKDTDSAIEEAKSLISILPSNNLSLSTLADFEEPELSDCPVASVTDKDSYKRIMPSFGKSVSTGFAKIGGSTVGIVATKGNELCSHACTKISRLVRFCDAFAIPVITFADSTGFTSLNGAAKVTSAYAEATTVKVTLITGQAYGAFYTAVAGTGANADITFAFDTSYISALPAQTLAPIMWADKFNADAQTRKALTEEFMKNECTAVSAATNGYVSEVITKEEARAKIFASLDMLSGKRVATLPKKHGTI